MFSRRLSTANRRRLWRWGGATAPTAVGEATAVASGTQHGAYASRSPSVFIHFHPFSLIFIDFQVTFH